MRPGVSARELLFLLLILRILKFEFKIKNITGSLVKIKF